MQTMNKQCYTFYTWVYNSDKFLNGKIPESLSAEKLVRMLQIVAEVLTDEDHLRQDLAVRRCLLDGLEVEKQQLLDVVVVTGQD
eukprot:scaffold223649_cov48-Prasinocladus_malaysianus.AAC.2